MSGFKKFKKELPSKENFFSSLTVKEISDKDYEHAIKVWNKFEMKIMKDCHNLYLKRDVFLLADVFVKFENNSLKNYRLCWSHYLTPSVLSWVANLNIINVKLKLIWDAEFTCSLKKCWEVEFIIFLKYSVKP